MPKDLVVCKFGGSSLADAEGYRRAARIVRSDPRRRYVVVSAPGKRSPDDVKITDMFLDCYAYRQDSESTNARLRAIEGRFRSIVSELKLSLTLNGCFSDIRNGIARSETPDYAASCGEYLSAVVMSTLLGYAFVDAGDVIQFDEFGRLQRKPTRKSLQRRMEAEGRAIIPGFYGRMLTGEVKTFSRGGSDITGALVARAVNASLYENWTDTDGVYSADPRMVEHPTIINTLTYAELGELASGGAVVFHEEAVEPICRTNVRVRIANTRNPEIPGTLVVPNDLPGLEKIPGNITGIAVRRGFTAITVQRLLLNKEVGVLRNLLDVFVQRGISVEHTPTGKNAITVVLSDNDFHQDRQKILEAVSRASGPERIDVAENLALITVVGRGMAHAPGVAAKLFAALSQSRISVRLIDQGASELSIVVGVEANDSEVAIQAIYQAFFADRAGGCMIYEHATYEQP